MKPKKNYVAGNQDEMYTPPHALEPLFPITPLEWKIWESATGKERLMEKSFRNKGYSIIGTSLCFGQDYFDYEPDFYYDIEVTNVPFSLKYKWITVALKRGKPFIFIVPYETTFANEFQVLFNEFSNESNEMSVLSPKRRINFKTPNYGWGKMVFDEKKNKEVMRGNSAQMPTCFVTYRMQEYIEKVYSKPLKTYYVPMRSVKYNSENEEIG